MIDNSSVAAVVAIGISIFISLTLSRGGYIYSFSGYGGVTGFGDIGGWAIILVFLIIFAFLFQYVAFAYRGIGTALLGAVLWFLLRSVDPFDIFPTSLVNSDLFYNSYLFLTSLWGLVLIVIIFAALGEIFEGEDDSFFMIPTSFGHRRHGRRRRRRCPPAPGRATAGCRGF